VAAVNAVGPAADAAGMVLLLPGWDKYSVWGWDAAGAHTFACLWRNTDDPGMPPAIRIRPGEARNDGACLIRPVQAGGLAELIARATGTSVRDVLQAMAGGAPRELQNQLRGLAS
jgi:hypothetical protein